MRKALIGTVVLAALAFAAPASAGCWATAGLAPPSEGTAAGQVWTARITVLQHGRNPLPDAAKGHTEGLDRQRRNRREENVHGQGQ
jgi:hypothetical protein